MKKILFIIIILISFASCEKKYKDIEPVSVAGTELKIDSAQWTPALIKVEDNHVKIYENKELRRVPTINIVNIFALGFLLGLVLTFIFFIVVIIKS